jgi:hypothetical protein
MKNLWRAALAGALLGTGACTLFPWSVRAPKADESEPPSSERIYFTDLGPDSIDVSSYPEAQRANYESFARTCARCHTLARAVNAPAESRLQWRFHLARMSLHSRLRHEGRIPKEQYQAALDFLDYDGRTRRSTKVFATRTEELRRRFEPVMERYLQELYEKESAR